MSRSNATPEALPPGAEPTAAIEARVRRRLIFMVVALLALPVAYLAGLAAQRQAPTTLEGCLPPGVTMATPTIAGPGNAGGSVAEVLAAQGATVRNGVILAADGAPIAFATPSMQADAARRAKPGPEGMQNGYRLIIIPEFDSADATRR